MLEIHNSGFLQERDLKIYNSVGSQVTEGTSMAFDETPFLPLISTLDEQTSDGKETNENTSTFGGQVFVANQATFMQEIAEEKQNTFRAVCEYIG